MSDTFADQSEPEFLGSGEVEPDRSGRRRAGKRTGVVAGAAVAVVAAVGVGAYGVVQLMSGGSSPASAVPADALGYVSLDLDPSASQKIEAIKILRKFPSLQEELDISSRDDLRRAVFEQIQDDGSCADLEYDRDIEPWIGDRIALAAVPDAKEGATPLVALQVSDEAQAKEGVRKLFACEDSDGEGAGDASEEPGISFVGEYLLLAEHQADADRMAEEATEASLEDDVDFTTWMGRTGDPGIVTMYASADAPSAIAEAQRRDGMHRGDSMAFGDDSDMLEQAFKDFEGAAGVLRFRDGAVEAEFSSKGLGNDATVSAGAGEHAATLPSTTAAALSVAFRDGWLEDQLDSLGKQQGFAGQSLEELMSQGERLTGLELPEDIETLLGDGLTVSVDAGADLEALTESPDPTQVPAGIRIQGDPQRIIPIIDKLKKAAGPRADVVEVRAGDGEVVVGLDKAYVDSLLKGGDLGSEGAFKAVVPDADRATALFYVNFDAGDGWAERLADLLADGDPEARRNIAPLDAFGASGWQDDDGVTHVLVRLTTD
jgi:hypothetical protein